MNEIEIKKPENRKYERGEVLYCEGVAIGAIAGDLGDNIRVLTNGNLFISQSPEIVTLWAVHQGDTDMSIGQPYWYFDSKQEAEEIAKKKGWWGGDAPVFQYSAIRGNNGEFFILRNNNPIVLGNGEESEQYKLRQKALAKLTEEEKEALGL